MQQKEPKMDDCMLVCVLMSLEHSIITVNTGKSHVRIFYWSLKHKMKDSSITEVVIDQKIYN